MRSNILHSVQYHTLYINCWFLLFFFYYWHFLLEGPCSIFNFYSAVFLCGGELRQMMKVTGHKLIFEQPLLGLCETAAYFTNIPEEPSWGIRRCMSPGCIQVFFVYCDWNGCELILGRFFPLLFATCGCDFIYSSNPFQVSHRSVMFMYAHARSYSKAAGTSEHLQAYFKVITSDLWNIHLCEVGEHSCLCHNRTTKPHMHHVQPPKHVKLS